MKFKYSFYGIAAVLVVQAILTVTHAYSAWPYWDVPMHFFGGLVIGMLGVSIHHSMTNKRHIRKVPAWYHFLFVTGFVMLIAVAWEFHEYILDNTLRVWFDWGYSQLSMRDTMADLALGFLGGAVAFFMFKKEL